MLKIGFQIERKWYKIYFKYKGSIEEYWDGNIEYYNFLFVIILKDSFVFKCKLILENGVYNTYNK